MTVLLLFLEQVVDVLIIGLPLPSLPLPLLPQALLCAALVLTTVDVVSAVSGRSDDKFLKADVFSPLLLTATLVSKIHTCM